MTRSFTVTAGALATAIAVGTIGPAAQMPPDVPYPGTKMTRQQVLDKMTSDSPGTTANPAKGEEVYAKHCAACHIFGETGTSVGPDLTTLSSRFRKRDTLESIMWPSKTISDQYSVTMFDLGDGKLVSGVIVREDARAVYVKNSDYLERPLPLALASIKERTESTVSLMPENLVADLTLDEIESLVAYVLSGK